MDLPLLLKDSGDYFKSTFFYNTIKSLCILISGKVATSVLFFSWINERSSICMFQNEYGPCGKMYLDTFTPTSHILHKDQFWMDWGYKCTGGNTIKH